MSAALESDCEMARLIMKELPEAYSAFPPDLLIGFINNTHGAKRRAQLTLDSIRWCLEWMAAKRLEPYELEQAVASAPPGREVFETYYGAGPIGTASDGRAIVLERIGAIPPRAFCKAISAEELIKQAVFNRQAAHLSNRVRCHRTGCNLRRAHVIIDMKGFSLAHMSNNFMRLTMLYINEMSEVFPECCEGFYLINAPAIFRGTWALVSPLLGADIRAKTHILGGAALYEPVFDRLGMVTDGPISEARLSWLAVMRDMAANGGAPPPFLTTDEAVVHACGHQMPREPHEVKRTEGWHTGPAPAAHETQRSTGSSPPLLPADVAAETRHATVTESAEQITVRPAVEYRQLAPSCAASAGDLIQLDRDRIGGLPSTQAGKSPAQAVTTQAVKEHFCMPSSRADLDNPHTTMSVKASAHESTAGVASDRNLSPSSLTAGAAITVPAIALLVLAFWQLSHPAHSSLLGVLTM